jgi:hypothetical protein
VEVCSSMGLLLPCLFLLGGKVVWHRPNLLVECLETFLWETFSSEVEGLGELVSDCL